MTDDPVKQALVELQWLVHCRCHPAYTGRNLRDPDCNCDDAEAVEIVADRIEAQAAEIKRLLGDVEKRRETRMSDDDLIRRGDALYAIAGWEIPSTAISALPAVTQPAPDTAADRISAQAAEIERLRGDLAKAVEALQIARVHVANNAEGWSVSRAPSRDDLTIVDSILSVLTGDKP